MSFPGGMELFLVLAVVMLLFGAKKLPELARSMGRAGKEFRSGMKDGAEAPQVAGPCPFCDTPVPDDARFCPGCSKGAAEIVRARSKPLTAAS